MPKTNNISRKSTKARSIKLFKIKIKRMRN